MIGTKNVEVKESNGGKGIGYGIGQYKIMDFTIFTSERTGKIKIDFLIEDNNPVEDGYEYEGVFGKVKAANKTAKVAFEGPFIAASGAQCLGSWVDPTYDKLHDKMGKDFAVLAEATDTREAMDAISANSVLDFLTKAISVIKGKYFYGIITAEEQLSQDGEKVYLNRTFKNYANKDKATGMFDAVMIVKPVEGSEVTNEGQVQVLTNDNKTIKFDPNNTWDFKPLAKPDADPVTGTTGKPNPTDDLPF